MNFGIDARIIKDKKLIFISISGIFLLNLMPIPVLSPLLILLSGMLLGIFIISVFASEDFNFLFIVYSIGFALRTFLSFFFYITSFILKGNYSPGFIFPNDGWSYSEQGWHILKFWERGVTVTMQTFFMHPNMNIGSGCSGNITPYDFFSAHVYSITGYSPLSLFFISSLAGSVAALFIYLIARELFSKRVARISSFLVLLWPSFILWSTQNVKEPMIVMFCCILVWSVFYALKYMTPGFLLFSFVSILALFKVGFVYGFIIVSAIFFSVLFLFMKHLLKNKFIVMLIITLALSVIYFLVKGKMLSWISEKSFYDVSAYGSIFEFLNYHRSVRAFGNLRFLENIDISSVGKAAAFLPLGLFYAIFSPFPWQIGNLTQAIAVPETIIFYALVPFTIKGVVFAYKKRFNQSILLISIIIAVILLLAMAEGNSGTLFRHRSIAFYFLFIFTGIGMSLKRCDLKFYT